MKKILSVFITTCLIFTLAVSLLSCGHDCKFSDRRSDDEYHWYACEIADCTEIDDKEKHDYVYKGIVKEATQESNGEKIYSCSVCKHNKSEALSLRE